MANKLRAPRSVRVLWHVRDLVERHPRRVLGILALSILAIGLGRGLYTIENGESGARLRFGRLVDDTVSPGLHFRMPLGIDEIVERRTGEVLRLEISGDWDRTLSLVSGDENLISVAAIVQYRILRLGDFLFSTDDAAAVVHQVVRAELLESAATMAVDDLLTAGKAGLQQQVQQRSQARFDTYGLGVSLVSVNLQSVAPPPEASEAFRAVLDARANAARGVSVAQSRADRRQRLARGRAAQVLAQAESTAERRRQQAHSAAQRFGELLTQARRAPELTRSDLHARMVREVLPRTRLIVLPPGEIDHIDLNVVDPDR